MPRIWYDDIKELINDPSRIVPAPGDPIETRLNIFFRDSLYFATIMAVMTSDTWYLSIPLIVAVITAAVYERSMKTKGNVEKFLGMLDVDIAKDGQICSLPSKNNPMVNKLPSDDPLKPKPCDFKEDSTYRLSIKKLRENTRPTFDSYGDVVNQLVFENKFYKTPGTDLEEDREKFYQFSLGEMLSKPSMKEGGCHVAPAYRSFST